MAAARNNSNPIFKRLSLHAATITAIIITLAVIASKGIAEFSQLLLFPNILLNTIPKINGRNIILLILSIIPGISIGINCPASFCIKIGVINGAIKVAKEVKVIDNAKFPFDKKFKILEEAQIQKNYYILAEL